MSIYCTFGSTLAFLSKNLKMRKLKQRNGALVPPKVRYDICIRYRYVYNPHVTIHKPMRMT